MTALQHEPWLEDELWLLKKEQPRPSRGNGHDPLRDATAKDKAQAEQTVGSTRFTLVIAVLLGVPQLAWIAFLGYLGLRFVS